MVTTNICPQLASTDPSYGLPLFHSYDSPCTKTSTGYLAGLPLPADEEDVDDDEEDELEPPLPDDEEPAEEDDELPEESRDPTVKYTETN